ncbi:histone acetyltransferase [Herbaspirillum sp. meg3]|jgi:RimJ/RimL family protein N-acetyltransferase|uniref:GNAT family N-acetyltransferase n=1 Tax=Herbaspirillum sp. meg3 TaxID=2025949 RepID=UPI000B98E490|nr:GNAT family N-acetyltransferase [Herbaspirillum sp. meg3]ASU37351.1 histone acetyltransferase [Herbaspirillum sp. meg3]
MSKFTTQLRTRLEGLKRTIIEASDKPLILVKELSPRSRRHLLRHFLALEEKDRLLRFGTKLSDELVTRYVEKIDFTRDTIFGVYDRKLRLLGVGHLAFAPRETSPVSGATIKARVAEFGVSVSAAARGMGVGTKLFERGAMHCRNADIDTLYMHCLSSNKVMMHIARKAGMEIHRDYGEADAYLKLKPANSVTVFQEAMEEQVAMIDYIVKANMRALFKWVGKVTGIGKPKS